MVNIKGNDFDGKGSMHIDWWELNLTVAPHDKTTPLHVETFQQLPAPAREPPVRKETAMVISKRKSRSKNRCNRSGEGAPEMGKLTPMIAYQSKLDSRIQHQTTISGHALSR